MFNLTRNCRQRTFHLTELLVASCLLLLCFKATVQSPSNSPKRYEKDGLAFDYPENWELSDQSNAAAQQLVLLDKALDAQIMIIALRGVITNAKQEEQAKAGLIEPSIARLLKQYEDAGIKVERVSLKLDVNGNLAEGAQLRFAVDGQPGTTDIYWFVLNQRLVQLFFIRPDKTASKAAACWDMVRTTLRIETPVKAKH